MMIQTRPMVARIENKENKAVIKNERRGVVKRWDDLRMVLINRCVTEEPQAGCRMYWKRQNKWRRFKKGSRGARLFFLFQFWYYSGPPLTMHSRDSGVNRAASSAFGGRSRRGKGTGR